MRAIMEKALRNASLMLGTFQGEESVYQAFIQSTELQFSRSWLLALIYSNLLELNMSLRRIGTDFPGRRAGRPTISDLVLL